MLWWSNCCSQFPQWYLLLITIFVKCIKIISETQKMKQFSALTGHEPGGQQEGSWTDDFDKRWRADERRIFYWASCHCSNLVILQYMYCVNVDKRHFKKEINQLLENPNQMPRFKITLPSFVFNSFTLTCLQIHYWVSFIEISEMDILILFTTFGTFKL